jgi:hypothetical protein
MRRHITAGGTVALAILLGGVGPSWADDGGGVTVTPGPGSVDTTVNAPGQPGGTTTQPISTSSGGVTCKWTLDDVDNTVMLQGADPSSEAAKLARDGGLYYNISCSDGSYYPGVFVPGNSPNGNGPLPTPASLAQQAVNRLPLPLPVARHNPSGDALVNLATWWWIDPQQWKALTQRTAAGPVWARVRATPVRTVWDPGDGSDAVSCRGAGTPYDTGKSAGSQSTDCSSTYRRSSAGQPQTGAEPNDRFFTVTVTVYWRVSWIGAGGAQGVLPQMARTTRFPLRVAERQTVVTGGSG